MVWIVMAGVAVDEHTPGTPADEGGPDAHPRRWVRLAALCAGVVACALVFGFVTDNEIAANTRFDQAHRALDVFYVTAGARKLDAELQSKLKNGLLAVCSRS